MAREGLLISYSSSSIFPMKMSQELECLPGRHSVLTYTKTEGGASSWSPGHRAPPLLTCHTGALPPPQLLEGVLGSGVCSPSLLTCLAQTGSFLAPGLFSLPRGSSGVLQRRRQPRGTEDWKQGPRRGVVVLGSPCKGAWAQRGSPQPPCSVEMKRMLSWSCSW